MKRSAPRSGCGDKMAAQPFFVIPYQPISIIESNARAERPASHLVEYLYPGMVWRTMGPQIFVNVAMDLGEEKSIDFFAMLGVSSWSGVTANAVMGTSLGGFEQYASASFSIPEPAEPPPAGFLGQWLHWLSAPINSRYPSAYIHNQTVQDHGATFFIVGKRMTFARYAEHDWEVGIDDLSTVTMTRGGVPDIAAGAIMRTISFTMKWVSEAEYFEKVAPLDMACGRGKPVLLCFDPDATSRRQALTFFGLLRENPRNRRINARAFERRFEMLSFI